MATNLRGKRILITAGPTWAPLDAVRVISNTASGETGILLAQALAGRGARVTLMLGPVKAAYKNNSVRVINFRFFDELRSLLKNELKKKRYAVIIHSAAVADYAPSGPGRRKKISSGLKTLRLNLKPTPKIIDSLRKASPGSFLIGFKFEPDSQKNKLLAKANRLMQRAGLDLIVANSIYKKKYSAYLISAEKHAGPFFSKQSMVKKLVNLI
ncbi:MAG: phosphopantothenoylcysteine decarboxylase [Candidatus Omnitrophota bacterium]